MCGAHRSVSIHSPPLPKLLLRPKSVTINLPSSATSTLSGLISLGGMRSHVRRCGDPRGLFHRASSNLLNTAFDVSTNAAQTTTDEPMQDPVPVQEPDAFKYHLHVCFDMLRPWKPHHNRPTSAKSDPRICRIGKVRERGRRTEMDMRFVIYDLMCIGATPR